MPHPARIQLPRSTRFLGIYIAKRGILSTAFLALLLVPLASAQDPAELRRLARDAGIIFRGTVQKIEPVASAGSGDIGLVRITFGVHDALRGATPGEPLTISEWDAFWTSGDRYRVGEDLLLFLYPPSGALGLTTTVAGARGRISLPDSPLSMTDVAGQIADAPSSAVPPETSPRNPIRSSRLPARSRVAQ